MQISLMDNLPSNRIGFKLLLRRGKDIINFIKMQVFFNNGSLKFEITAKRLYAASQRVL